MAKLHDMAPTIFQVTISICTAHVLLVIEQDKRANVEMVTRHTYMVGRCHVVRFGYKLTS